MYRLSAVMFALISNCANAQEYPVIADTFAPKFLVEEFGKNLGATSASSARPLEKVSFEMIKHFEGWIPGAYNDPAGYCTIGYGHLIALKTCESIDLGIFSKILTEKEGSDLLDKDLVGARLAVQNLLKVQVNDKQFGSLVSFTFNVGSTAFRKSTLLSLVNKQEFDAASQQFARWVKADGKVYSGLVARRACEAAVFRGEVSLGSNGRFDRSACANNLGLVATAGSLIDVDRGE